MGFQEATNQIVLNIGKKEITLSSPAILTPISEIMHIWRSFVNSKFYRVYMSSLSVLPPSLAASFESFSKHPKCYQFVLELKEYCLEIVSLLLLFVCFVNF